MYELKMGWISYRTAIEAVLEDKEILVFLLVTPN